MRWKRPWFWPFRKFLVSRGDKVPTYIPAANEFAEKFARLTGGTAMSMLPEILFNVPGTAHCIGGCVIAESPERGVVDHRHRVFGYKNMYVCDGSVVAANLGVNPSLTITALAERAMSFIAPRGGNVVERHCRVGPRIGVLASPDNTTRCDPGTPAGAPSHVPIWHRPKVFRLPRFAPAAPTPGSMSMLASQMPERAPMTTLAPAHESLRPPRQLDAEPKSHPILGDQRIAYLEALVSQARAAAAAFSSSSPRKTWTALSKPWCWPAWTHAQDLARLAIEETRLGVLEDKFLKNMVATEFVYNYVKDKRTVGVIREFPDRGLVGSGRTHRSHPVADADHQSHLDGALQVRHGDQDAERGHLQPASQRLALLLRGRQDHVRRRRQARRAGRRLHLPGIPHLAGQRLPDAPQGCRAD